jgi:hypothetical protein
MKKIIYVLITIIFFSNCLNKITLVKRKFNKGYYISVVKKHSTQKGNQNIVKQNQTKHYTPINPVVLIETSKPEVIEEKKEDNLKTNDIFNEQENVLVLAKTQIKLGNKSKLVNNTSIKQSLKLKGFHKTFYRKS